MSVAVASVTSDAPLSPPILNNTKNASAFFKRLSFKAAKNWHQKSGAKRRARSRDRDMAASIRGGFRPAEADEVVV